MHVVQGQYRGIRLKCIDTPGLSMSGSSLTGNQAQAPRHQAGHEQAPAQDLVLYVDRNDVVRSRGSLPCLDRPGRDASHALRSSRVPP